MSFQPVTPLGGLAGWAFLNRTMARQTKSFDASAEIERDTVNFRTKIGGITSAKELVSDHQLLKVALGAFGLDGDLDKKFFIQKVLQEGTADPAAMANKLVDRRYVQLTDAFGFGSALGSKTGDPGFADKITAAYKTRQFEIAVGQQNEPFRLAMTFQREISAIASKIASKSSSDKTAWYTVLGSPPLRKVLERAYNLPSQFAALDLDRQINVLKDKTLSLLGNGDISVFKDPKKIEALIHRFLIMDETNNFNSGTSSTSTALTLLQNAQNPAGISTTFDALFASLY